MLPLPRLLSQLSRVPDDHSAVELIFVREPWSVWIRTIALANRPLAAGERF